MDRGDNAFLNSVPEVVSTNQYWYSAHTIKVLASEAVLQARAVTGTVGSKVEGRIGCVSTPSIFFSLPLEVQQKHAVVFDFDQQFAEKTENFVFYDFNHPVQMLDSNKDLQHSFDVLVIDPPFITEEVWTKYAQTATALLKPGGKLICTTISENAVMMKRLLNVEPVNFRPSIPNLVYQ